MQELNCLSDIILDDRLPGDKIRLPHEIFSKYIDNPEHVVDHHGQEIQFPLSFKLTVIDGSGNLKELVTSVLDFSGDSGMVIVPQWMFFNLYPLQMGDPISIELYSGGYSSQKISKGSVVRLRPHTSDFLNIEDHRTVLENQLKYYSILNQFTTIKIDY